jgi:tannase/feruloyl esterase
MAHPRFKISSYGAIAALTLAAFATSARAQAAKVDIDEQRTSPVEHRFIHGTLGDADFQMALPDPTKWNGKVLIGARGFSGDENSAGAFKTVGLQKGYAYALSDQGWARATIINETEDKYFESKRRIHQLTAHTKAVVHDYYGAFPKRTFMVGGSNGGHNTKMMVEEYPGDYDGGLAGYGITSHLEWMGSNTRFLRNYDVFGSRINAIIAAQAAAAAMKKIWNPVTDALSPPLTAAQIQALLNVYNMPASVGGIDFNVGRVPGSEYRWSYSALLGYAHDSVAKMDRFYDPNGDGVVTDDEIKLWDPHLSPPPVANDLRRFDNTGNLKRPIIIGHGSHDPTVSPGETYAYERLVRARLGARAPDFLAVYWFPKMGHGGNEYDASIGVQLDALEAWVTWHQTSGRAGSLPPAVLVAGVPRDEF